MAPALVRKNSRIDPRQLARARRAVGTKTETETIRRALRLADDERAFARALQRLIVRGRGQFALLDDDAP